ncbi:hypothetical protein Ddc_12563 [Ditylenchus destructor]|nr:hypothetical protein Ddc_12563 [Ditylenchus destructor]
MVTTMVATIIIDIENVAILLFSFVSVAIFSHLLYRYAFRNGAGLRVRNLSRCMISYMVFNVIGLITSAPYYFYQTSLFPKDSPDLQLWLITVATTHLEVMPLTVFFLALERCLAIQFRFTSRIETIVFTCNIICVLLIVVINMSLYHLYAGSLITFAFKMVLGVLNACACAYLFWKVKHFQPQSFQSESAVSLKNHAKNTIVKFTCVTELCLEFLPNLTATIMIMAGGSGIFDYTGPFASTTQCLNVMICAIIYNRTLYAKNGNGTAAVVVTHTSKYNA